MAFSKTFDIANPSPYERTDYVEIDLKTIGIPDDFDEDNLQLYRIDNNETIVPFQIDDILGDKSKRIMVFLAEKIPMGINNENYEKKSATFVLKWAKQKSIKNINKNLCIKYHYSDPIINEPKERFDKKWFKDRKLDGIKLENNFLKIYFSFVPYPGKRIDYKPLTNFDLSGCFTTIYSNEFDNISNTGEVLNSYQFFPDQDYPMKCWGQIYKLVFFPLPWRLEWFKSICMKQMNYELISAKYGSIRVIIVVKSDPFKIQYNGEPYFHNIELTANLYRIIYMYPQKPYYIEELFVQTTDKEPQHLSFRPYYKSSIHYPYPDYNTELARMENVPDYFAYGKYNIAGYYSFAFAADAHVRSIEYNEKDIKWRLSYSFHNKTVHQFSCHAFNDMHFDKYKKIGHFGWYEQCFKPLEMIPFTMRFQKPIP